MKTFAIITAAALIAGCATAADTRAVPGFDPAATTFTGWVRVTGGEFQLFQDQRPDDSVDLAIGTEFNELAHSDDIEAMLASLKPDATQPADTSLLPKIHSGTC